MGRSSPISYIYTLSDPSDGAVRYVGKTDTPSNRKFAHYSTQPGTSHRARWINKLRAEGKRPVFQVVQIVSRAEWPKAERAWIQQLIADGADLVNHDDGGVGATAGGKQARIHYLKRVLWQDYQWFVRNGRTIAADKLASKLRWLYVNKVNMPATWQRVGL